MEFIKPIISIIPTIYTLVNKVKANKKDCQYVAARVKDIEFQVKYMRESNINLEAKGVKKALSELTTTLESAQKLIEKYTVDERNLFKRLLKISSHRDDFMALNNRLNHTSQVLLLAMQVERSTIPREVIEKSKVQKQDEVDRREDDEQIKKFLLENLQKEEERLEALRREVLNKLDQMNKPSAANEERRLIKPEELKCSEVPFVTTNISEVYKGEYHGFTVAIKRFINPVDTSFSEIKSIFKKEVETMRHFESPNILRMFGICVKNEKGPNPEYLIVMEYMEKHSLREVLDSDCELSWVRKARMCLDAAQGLYRLHQTEDKFKVHGHINSSNLFVDESYRVKLGGFELAQTETSLNRGRNYNEVRSRCYSSPQMLNSIDEPYSKECEIYSLGVVMWEIATRQHPFEDPVTKVKWTNKEFLQRVCKDKYIEPLPEDCPKALGDLINSCRAYDSFHRPSAGVLMDKLRIVVAQLEE